MKEKEPFYPLVHKYPTIICAKYCYSFHKHATKLYSRLRHLPAALCCSQLQVSSRLYLSYNNIAGCGKCLASGLLLPGYSILALLLFKVTVAGCFAVKWAFLVCVFISAFHQPADIFSAQWRSQNIYAVRS